MRRFITIGALAARLTGAFCLSASAVAVAQGPGAEPEKCLSLNRIQKTEVIDDRNIIFYMRGGQIFRNQLSHRCSGLRKDNTIMYRPSLNRLCNLDFITVLRDFSFGFTQGPSCGLGQFYPIDEFGVAKLKEQAEIKKKLRK